MKSKRSIDKRLSNINFIPSGNQVSADICIENYFDGMTGFLKNMSEDSRSPALEDGWLGKEKAEDGNTGKTER